MRYALIIICLMYSAGLFSALGCGGGWAPYIPPNISGSTGQTKARLQLFEKGVTYDLFDPKVLQPLIRNIVLSGNERKNRKTSKAPEDSTAKLSGKEEPKPILNIHRLH